MKVTVIAEDDSTRLITHLPSRLIIPDIPGKDWRDYQKDIINDCWEAFQDGYTRIYYKLTVAGGKTLTSAAIADNFLREGLPVLWLAHNKKLLSQAKETFQKMGQVSIMEQGANDARYKFISGASKLVIGSIASMRGDRLKRWERDTFAIIIYDECDLSLAPKNIELIKHFNAARLLGMTGTDDRGDGRNLGALYQKRILSLNLKEATEKGMTVPVTCNRISVEPPIDLRNLTVRTGDFDAGELGDAVKRESEIICSAISKDRNNALGIGDRSALAFCPNIESAEIVAENLNKFGISAKALHSKLGDMERVRGENDFVAGKFQVLVNPLAYTVGTDFPFVSCIILLRPTKVRRLLEQMVGRGVRLQDKNPLSAGKTDCLVIDFPWLVNVEHDLIHVTELFDDGSLNLIQENSFTSMAARTSSKKMNRQIYKEFLQREVTVTSVLVDPFGMAKFFGVEEEFAKRGKEDNSILIDATILQTLHSDLRSQGVASVDKLTYAQGLYLSRLLQSRKEHQLCDATQFNGLIKLGIPLDIIKQLQHEKAAEILEVNKQIQKLRLEINTISNDIQNESYYGLYRQVEALRGIEGVSAEVTELYIEIQFFNRLGDNIFINNYPQNSVITMKSKAQFELHEHALKLRKEIGDKNFIEKFREFEQMYEQYCERLSREAKLEYEQKTKHSM